MKTESKTTDSATDRHLGPLASFMRAAEPLAELTANERERIRHRLHAGVVASHRLAAGFRWSTALAALGLLLAGGAVFAAAGHFGLIPWPRETKLQNESEPAASPARRRPARAVRPKSNPAASAPAAIAPPDVAVSAPAPPAAKPVAPEAGPRLARLAPATSKQAVRAVRAPHIAPAPAPVAATSGQSVMGEALHGPPTSASGGDRAATCGRARVGAACGRASRAGGWSASGHVGAC